MMSEKRFQLLLPHAILNDTKERKSYYLSEKDDAVLLCDLLNKFNDERKNNPIEFSELLKLNFHLKRQNWLLKVHFDCLERAVEQVFNEDNPSVERIIEIYNELKEDSNVEI